MKLRKLLLGTACCALSALHAMGAGTSATFDWEEFEGNWWDDTSWGYTEMDNAVTMTASGRATGNDGGDGAGGANGVAYKADYSHDLVAGAFNMSENGEATYFIVNSIEVSGGSDASFTPTVEGKAGGTVVWTITPPDGTGLVEYTAATTGDMTAPIDKIVWNTGESAAPGENYGNKIDNLSIVTADAPAFEAGEAIFDWEEFTGAWWADTSWGYTETNNGITMISSGRASGSDGGDGIGGANGSAYKATYSQDLTPGYFNIEQNGEATWFVVKSIDIGANGGNPEEFIPTVQGQADGVIMWEIVPSTDAGMVTYSEATSGDITLPVEQIIWNTGQHSDPDNTFGNTIDNLSIVTSKPAFETIYDWDFSAFWTPHAVFSWNLDGMPMDILGFDQYWWSGGDTTGTPVVIKHRPGLADLPEGGGFGGAPNDINVGGFGNRGLYVADPARILVTNEAFRVTYDWKMFVNGSDGGRFMDMFFSTSGNTDAKRFGQTGSELGFAWYQSAESNDVAITFAADDDWMSSTPAVLRIPLTGLGIDVGTADHDGDELAITYSAKKTTTTGMWLCSILVSNKATTATFGVENVNIVNGVIYDSESYFCVATPDDLSDGDVVSGANPAGYEIDNLRVVVLLNPPPAPEGYEAFLVKYDMDGKANSGEYEDFDADGMLNVYEYGWGGDPTNPAVQGVLPVLSFSGGDSLYTMLELKDSESGISYVVQTTTDLIFIPWSEPIWESENTTSYNELYNEVARSLNTTDVEFFRSSISTNTP